MTTDPRWARGAAAFNASQFFSAHEIWEELWLESVGPWKQLLQGLVQVAAGYAKAESGQRSGALKLLTRGLERLRDCGTATADLGLEPFLDGVAADVERLRQTADGSAPLDFLHVPHLRVP